jgi:phospholipase/carboxylesterase
MNRIGSFAGLSKSVPVNRRDESRRSDARGDDWESRIESGRVSVRSDRSPSTLFGPVHYEPNYAYPLVIWLHGDGLSERQLLKVMPLVSLRNYVAVAPRGPFRLPEAEIRSAFSWSERPGDLAAAEHCIFEALDEAAAQYHIAEHRVFLAGAGTGGTTALRLALMHAERFAGAASLGGPFPSGQAPLARLTEARNLPLFLAHGRGDSAFDGEALSEQLRLFHAAGMNVTLRQYPGDSTLAPHMLSDMNRWLMEIVTGTPAVS